MDMAVQLRSIAQLTEVVLSMANYLQQHKSEITPARSYFLAGIVTRRMQGVLRRYLLDMNDSQFNSSDFNAVVEKFKAVAPLSLHVTVNRRIDLDLLESWTKTGTRLPQWRRSLLIKADNLMQQIYRALFY